MYLYIYIFISSCTAHTCIYTYAPQSPGHFEGELSHRLHRDHPHVLLDRDGP